MLYLIISDAITRGKQEPVIKKIRTKITLYTYIPFSIHLKLQSILKI